MLRSAQGYELHPKRAVVVERFLREHGLARSVGAELGVFRGQTTFHLLETLPELAVVAIDTWCNQLYEVKDGSMQPRQFADVEADFDRRRGRFADRLAKIKDDSVTALRKFPAGHFDWVFIDGDHSFEGAARDIRESLRVVKPTGWILGHDYDWPGVRKALDTILPDARWLGEDSVWAAPRF